MTNIETLLLRKLDELIFLNKNDDKIVRGGGENEISTYKERISQEMGNE